MMMTNLILRRFTVGSYGINGYLVEDPETRIGVFIDPGGFSAEIEAFIREREILLNYLFFTHGHWDHTEVNMCILSNFTPECKVEVEVSCPIDSLKGVAKNVEAKDFAYKFKQAVDIAQADIRRAVTHNKGIFNGIDAVILATGNDFRAIEACGHAYAARDGSYRGLTTCDISEGEFSFKIDILNSYKFI